MREYDEFERALTGRRQRGLHPLAWLAIGFATLTVLSAVAVGAGAVFMVLRAKDFVAEFEANPALTAAEVLSMLDPALEVLSRDDGAQTVTVRDARSNRTKTVDFEDILEGALNPQSRDISVREGGADLDVDGSLRVRTDEGEISFDLEADEEGGRLIIRTDEGELLLGSGRDAQGIPRYVPIFRETEGARPVYSARTADGFLGAVAWETSASPQEVTDFYARWLEEQGFETRSERYSEGPREGQGAVWGRSLDDDRTVFVVAVREDGTTKVFLNYGEKE